MGSKLEQNLLRAATKKLELIITPNEDDEIGR